MKKMCKLLLGLSALFTFTLTSCEATGGNNNKSGDTSVELSGFEKTGDVYKTKVNNDVQSFSFIDKVSVSSNSTWKLYSDISGTQEIVTKTISLDIGDNQSYVLVTAPNGDLGFYSVVVRRLDLYTVSFNTRGGSSIESQNVQEESLISPVANPTKTGYAFDKWDYDFTEPVMKDLTINASWVANSHTITFDVNGGNPLDSNTMAVDYGTSVTLPKPTRDGYTFNGWYNGTSRVNDGKWSLDSDVTLVADWSANKYKITYRGNGGFVIANSEPWNQYTDYVYFDDDYSVLSASRDGYTFTGWFYNEVKVESGFWKIANDVTLLANWNANQYTITFDVNGGNELDSKTKTVIFDNEVTLPTPTKDGYEFKGWYYNNSLVESGKWMINDNVTLVAKWEVITYKVSLSNPSSETHYFVNFDLNDGNGINSSQEVFVGQPITKPNDPTSGSQKKFRGWFTDKECTNTFEFNETITKTITLYAGWYQCTNDNYGTNIKYNKGEQTYSIEGGYKTGYFYSYLAIPKTQKYTIEMPKYTYSMGATIETVIKSLYSNDVNINTIIGYEKYVAKPDQKFEINCKAGDLLQFRFYDTYNSKTNSSAGPYNLRFKMNVYGDAQVVSSSLSKTADPIPLDVTYGTSYNLGTINYFGYTFNGWYTGENGSGTKLTGNDGLSIAPWLFTNISNVFAYLVPNEHTITYDADGGIIDSTTQKVSFDSPYTLKETTKEGYTFLGWYNGYVKFENGIWNLDEDITLKAKWEANQYSVKMSTLSSAHRFFYLMDKNDGTGVYNKFEIYRTDSLIAYQYPTPCTREGYIFTGWFNEPECLTYVDFDADINSNKTIYAGWRKPNVGNVFYNLILNGSTFTTTCTNGGSMTMYYFTALSDETYKIQCSCSNSTALYFRDIDDGQSTHDPVKTFSSGGGSYSINVVKGKTYVVSFACTSSSYETGTTVIVSLSGYWPSVTSHIGSNPDLTLTFTYGKSFYLGYPIDWIEGDFNGWFTGENGTGIRLTDENGQSVTNWNFTEDINAYPYYVY